jgi:hypothetical protein
LLGLLRALMLFLQNVSDNGELTFDLAFPKSLILSGAPRPQLISLFSHDGLVWE